LFICYININPLIKLHPTMKIVTIGAVLVDMLAEVEAFPKEDGEVFVPRLKLMPGGSAANTAVLCSRLGAETGFIGKVGKDPFGEELIKDFQKEKVDTKGISQSALPTGSVYVAVRKDRQRMMFAHSGAANDLQESDIDLDYLNGFDHLHLADLENISVLEYVASHFKGSISLSAGALIAAKAHNAAGLLKKVNILICSEEEAEQLSGTEGVDDCLKALCRMGPKITAITRGDRPTKGYDCKDIYEAEVFKVPVVDTTGAGDSFSAGFLVNYLETEDLQDSMLFGNAVASSVIQHKGARSGVGDKSGVDEIPEIKDI
jgi:ribokinase